MIGAVRRQKIAELVHEKKSASVSELASIFSVTGETIRRDLKALESEGTLKRSYGGAYVQTGVDNLVDVNIRTTAYRGSKEVIASRCLQFVNNGDTIFLDNSTTCFYIAKLLQDMRITVLTNNLMILNLLSKCPNIRLIGIGGNYSTTEKAFYGPIAELTIGRYYVDTSFLSCRSLSLKSGITDSTDRWNDVRRIVLEHSQRTYFVADYSKFDNTSFVHLCDFNEVTGIITDHPLSEAWRESLDKTGCILIDED
ncbi:DeoR/GlpR family DNA-binding transcription regulator [Olsenella sp. Marseille-P4559]|uniref:DeoR/GlpR family DNA-binding transcription regulator n=1 Tax=Olsenella sp. Marseille-P4559 TaxID=2364795 RepID=UPI001030F6D3|nr:DeoR/GlpR family DNA-binding transcription regulator [Olsenella sp. Marseille-P4559]